MTGESVTRAVAAALCAVCVAVARPEASPSEVCVLADAGWVCGLSGLAEGVPYVSFRGVPYAKQPVGELRFKELEPVEPWSQPYLAMAEGPICYQTDVIYGRIMQPRGMSEACIYANIYVPQHALLGGSPRPTRELQTPHRTGYIEKEQINKGLPILVMVHGGGFQGGSGDPDLHGPEYLVSKNVIVITFNYRLNVFGFLSLNSPEIPGNQGLRDMVTLLRWVKKNAKAFGGDPENVTLMGQSAGAAAVHLLSLSKATEGLFKRAFLMSGVGTAGFYSASPIFAEQLSMKFLATLGINSTDAAADIHRQLVQLPVEKIHEANKIMLDKFGLTTFVPTIESQFPGVTRVLDEDPEVLVAKGRGKDVPLVIGFTSAECEVFRKRFDQIDIASKIIENPILPVPVNIIFTTLPKLLPDMAKTIDQKYFNGTTSTDAFIKYCTDGYYKYPALKLAEQRASSGGASVFLYEFTYDSDNSVLREALGLHYEGAAHIEDLTYVFKVNSIIGARNSFPPQYRDDYMRDWMTSFVVNFMLSSKPLHDRRSQWPPVKSRKLQFHDIRDPLWPIHRDLTNEQLSILQFFDNLRPK